eukprot:9503924-Pyramimonas_sp.AAC.1
MAVLENPETLNIGPWRVWKFAFYTLKLGYSTPKNIGMHAMYAIFGLRNGDLGWFVEPCSKP